MNAGSQLMDLRHFRHFIAAVLRVHPARETTVRDRQSDAEAAAALALLAYELLDAHSDTAQLADGLAHDRSWEVHLDYLRALQRKGRETLARTASGELSSFHSAGRGSLDVR